MLVRPHLSRQSHARLNLIKDQESFVLVGEAPHLQEEFSAEVVVAALALNRLDDDRSNIVRMV